jgi:hypothetical protein
MARSLCVFLILLVLGARMGAPAEGETPPESATAEPTAESSGSSPAPKLQLDRLLRVPGDAVSQPQLLGGKDRPTWQAEFATARREVDELEQRIADTQRELRETAPDDWAFAPTGGGAPTDPGIMKLRATLRRDRQSLEAARERLRELDVEASLAGVPVSWRQPDEP